LAVLATAAVCTETRRTTLIPKVLCIVAAITKTRFKYLVGYNGAKGTGQDRSKEGAGQIKICSAPVQVQFSGMFSCRRICLHDKHIVWILELLLRNFRA
jgi:hypothetical protein